jgi:hypothetical protein
LGSGLNEVALTLAVDGSDNLYAGGWFTATGDGATTLNNIARWNGSSWSALGSGTDGIVRALAVSGSGPAYALEANLQPMGGGGGVAPDSLYVGGDFTRAGDKFSAYLAQWSLHRVYLPIVMRQ